MAHPLLVSAAQLNELRGAVILDVRQSASSYAAGHLPNAIHADLNAELSTASDPDFDPADGGRHPLPPLDRFLRQLGEWGIEPATQVVLYDDQAGANAAARLWWMLRAVGHDKVSILDGGLDAATGARVDLTTHVPTVEPKPPYPAAGWSLPTVALQDVDQLRQREEWKVLDVRSQERFRGESEPFDPVAGHIPGAVNLPYGENLENGRFKSPEALRAQYVELLDGTPSEQLVVHCGSGVTACHTLFALELAGLSGGSLYVGSWSEWCRRKSEVRRVKSEKDEE